MDEELRNVGRKVDYDVRIKVKLRVIRWKINCSKWKINCTWGKNRHTCVENNWIKDGRNDSKITDDYDIIKSLNLKIMRRKCKILI